MILLNFWTSTDVSVIWLTREDVAIVTGSDWSWDSMTICLMTKHIHFRVKTFAWRTHCNCWFSMFPFFFEIQLLVCDRIVNQYFSIPHQNTVFLKCIKYLITTYSWQRHSKSLFRLVDKLFEYVMTVSICPFYRKDTVDEAFCPFSCLKVHKETLLLETHCDVINYKIVRNLNILEAVEAEIIRCSQIYLCNQCLAISSENWIQVCC